MKYIDKDKYILKHIYAGILKARMESLTKLRNYYVTVYYQTQEGNREMEDIIDFVGAIVCTLENMATRPPELR